MEGGRQVSGPSPWTRERDATLTAHWNAGHSSTVIGKVMGITKNAVIGRAHRLKLPRRAAPPNIVKQDSPRVSPSARVKAGRGAFSPRTRPAITSRPRVGEPGAAASTAHCPSSLNSPEADARETNPPPPRVFSGTKCKFPLRGDERPAEYRFCDEPVRDNAKGRASPYCAAHFALCLIPPRKKSAGQTPPDTWLRNRSAWRVGA